MPVLRYRDVREVGTPDVVDVDDPSLVARILDLSAFAAATVGPLHRPGVTRFASIEAAGRAREEALLARMRRSRAARVAGEHADGEGAAGERTVGDTDSRPGGRA